MVFTLEKAAQWHSGTMDTNYLPFVAILIVEVTRSALFITIIIGVDPLCL